ncbi:MAG: hypothetical protein L0H15_04570, partial [Nitrosospira sp.]|nr:hypothetical protein [Nitrosospira sp.]
DVLRVEQDISFVPSAEATANLARVLDVQEAAFLRLAGYQQLDDATVSAAYNLINLADKLEDKKSKDQLPQIREALGMIS